MESNLVIHANREFDLLGYPQEKPEQADFDYDWEVRKAALELIQQFADQHHSGTSAHIVLHLVTQLMDYKPLSPITDDPAEWHEAMFGGWQSLRRPDAFSIDGGVTHYLLNEKRKWFNWLWFRLPTKFRIGMPDPTYRKLMYPFHTSKISGRRP